MAMAVARAVALLRGRQHCCEGGGAVARAAAVMRAAALLRRRRLCDGGSTAVREVVARVAVLVS